jgi:hypothetical protein
VPTPSSPTAAPRRVVRGMLLIFGIGVMTVALVGLMDQRLDPFDADPWWYVGLVGLVAVLFALGSPRSGRIPDE